MNDGNYNLSGRDVFRSVKEEDGSSYFSNYPKNEGNPTLHL